MATNGQNSMLPLQLLLNPDSPGSVISQPIESRNPRYSLPAPAVDEEFPERANVSFIKMKKAKDSNNLPKPGPRGPINFPPFENLDEASLQQVAKFDVTPFGRIHQGYEHFPYNSEKRDLLEKTGRESIEAFMYEFKVPGNASTYVVMWDYNIGIVRLASLFRLCGFNKTGPAQTVSKNPGLLDITPNITGGAVPAQGYWFPYRCAKAICAKFCHHIAGALIPIFGPNFPSECTPPDSPRYRRLDISQQVLVEAAQESGVYRRIYGSRNMKPADGLVVPPRTERISFLRGSYGLDRQIEPRFQEPPVLHFGPREELGRSAISQRRQSIMSREIDEGQTKPFTPATVPTNERRQPRYPFSHSPPHMVAMDDYTFTRGHKRRKTEDEDDDVGSRGRYRTTSREERAKELRERKTRPDTEQYGAALILVSIRMGSEWPDDGAVGTSRCLGEQ